MKLHLAARPSVLLVAGVSGSGKTTFAFRYLVANEDLEHRFIFDPEDEAAQRLGLSSARSVEELEASLDDGFTVFDPHSLYPGKLDEAFNFFCQWAFDVSADLPGEKVLAVDEAWRYCSPGALPVGLATVIQTGRKRRLGSMFMTQRPNRLNEAITNETTELVCFRLQGDNALKRVESLGVQPDEVSSLPPGAYVAVNETSGAILRGRVF